MSEIQLSDNEVEELLSSDERLIERLKNEKQRGYSCGYQAGLKREEKVIIGLHKKVAALRSGGEIETQKERVFMRCLAIALDGRQKWREGDKPINDVEGYVSLANDFAKASMRIIRQ